MGKRLLLAGFVKLLNTSIQMAYPILINLILEFIEELQEGKISMDEVWYKRYRGYWLAALLFIAMAAKALTESIYFSWRIELVIILV